MGTRLLLKLEGPASVLKPVSEAALAEVERIEAACSTWRPESDWSRLSAAHGAPVRLAREWMELLSTALQWQKRTQGAFDPVLAALMRAWDIRVGGGRAPDANELALARAASGGQLLALDSKRQTAQLLHPNAGIEEGGFVKGYALDRAQSLLERGGVISGLLSFGGQLWVWGQPQPVEIAGPQERVQATLSLTLARGSVSTSGYSEHGRHILDPATGTPCPAWGAVTVVMPDGLSADVLSLALYVMGPAAGLRWANEHDIAAVLQPNDGPPLMSRRFSALHPRILNPS